MTLFGTVDRLQLALAVVPKSLEFFHVVYRTTKVHEVVCFLIQTVVASGGTTESILSLINRLDSLG